MRYFLTILLLFCLTTQCFADDLRKKAEENPLDCVYYLLINSDDHYKESKIIYLAQSYWQVGRRQDAIRILKIETEKPMYRDAIYLRFVDDLLKEKKNDEALPLLLKAASLSENNNQALSRIVARLTLIDQHKEAVEIAESIEDPDDKAEILIVIAEKCLQNEQKEEALELLSRALEYARESKWEDSKTLAIASIGELYAKAKQNETALELLEEAWQKVQTVEIPGDNIRINSIEKIIEGFAELGRCDRAFALLQQGVYPNNELETKDSSLAYIKVCNDGKAKIIKSQMESTIDDEFELSMLYLQKGNIEKALSIAESGTPSYRQADTLIKIADAFLKIGKMNDAIKTLTSAFHLTKKIKSDEPESGYMSTSPAYRKAQSLAKIADKFMDINRYDLALNVINSIEKPFIKANKLADFAARQAKTKGQQKAFDYLSQALKLVRKKDREILDANRYSVMINIATSYASINATDKATDVLAEILEWHEEIESNGGNTYLLQVMCEVGQQFDKNKLKANERMKKTLREIIESMEED